VAAAQEAAAAGERLTTMSRAPIRIQRRRTPGWRMPPGAKYCGRPGRFGNPFDWLIFGREGSVDLFRRWLADELSPQERQSTGLDVQPDLVEKQRSAILEGLDELRGRDLVCWCGLDMACHVDVYLELANRPAP